MKRFILLGCMLGAALAFLTVAHATVPVPVGVSYTLPTQACVYVNGVATTTCGPLTGADALTGIEVYFSLAPIADGATLTPVVTLPPTASTYTSTFQAGNGDKYTCG